MSDTTTDKHAYVLPMDGCMHALIIGTPQDARTEVEVGERRPPADVGRQSGAAEGAGDDDAAKRTGEQVAAGQAKEVLVGVDHVPEGAGVLAGDAGGFDVRLFVHS